MLLMLFTTRSMPFARNRLLPLDAKRIMGFRDRF